MRTLFIYINDLYIICLGFIIFLGLHTFYINKNNNRKYVTFY